MQHDAGMRASWLGLSLTVLAACSSERSSPPDAPDPALCPVNHEQCGFSNDGAVQTGCDGNNVTADDLTVHSYCTPGGSSPDDVVCWTGGVGDPRVLHVCATGCDPSKASFFDFHGDFMTWESTGGPQAMCL